MFLIEVFPSWEALGLFLLSRSAPYALYHLESVSACHSPSHMHTNAHLLTHARTHSLMSTCVFLHNCSIYLNRCVQTFSSIAHTHTQPLPHLTLKMFKCRGAIQGNPRLLWMSPPPPPYMFFYYYFFFYELHCSITLSICWEEVRQTMRACVCAADHIWGSAAGTAITLILNRTLKHP